MTTRKTLLTCIAVAAAALLAPSLASAHTETDLVAVPAGSEATVTLQPTHGCGDSPTVEVAIQAPVGGAVGGEVEGWTVEAVEADGKTEVTWSGGSLPSDQAGAFPVTFTAPNTPGELLVFPAIQVCENGEEMAWINGDPASDYPAPRVLVLDADAVPASAIDDVPADAPGRDQLTEIIDVDDPGADEGEGEPAQDPQDAADEAPSETVSPEEPTQTTASPSADGEAAPSDDDDSNLVPILIGIAVVGVILGIIASVMVKRRNDAAELEDLDHNSP